MQRYELIEGKSAKFWEVEADGTTLTVRFGRIGTNGQTQTKTFADAAAALKERDKLIKEKTGKGYTETAVAQGAALAAVAPKVAKSDDQVEAAGAAAEVEQSNTTKIIAKNIYSARTNELKDHKNASTGTAEALDWPQGGIDHDLMAAVDFPIVRGVNCPAFVAWPDPLAGLLSAKAKHLKEAAEYQAMMQQALGANAASGLIPGGVTPFLQTQGDVDWSALGQPDTKVWEAALLRFVFGEPTAYWFVDREKADAPQRIMHAGIERHGVAFMIERVLNAYDNAAVASNYYTHPYSVEQPAKAMRVLRHAIASADESTYAAALAVAERERAGSDLRARVCAHLFAHRQDWVGVALACKLADSEMWLSTCAMSVDEMREYAKRTDPFNYYGGPAVYLMGHMHGAAALPLLDDMLARAEGKEVLERVLTWLRAVRYPGQIEVLVRHMEGTKETRAALDKVAEQHPAATLYTAIAHTLRTGSRMVQGWALRLATRHPDALARAMAAMTPEAAAAWQKVMSSLATEEAPASALPALLQNPPWLQKVRPQALPTLAVQALPVANRIEGPQSEAERLSSYGPNKYEREHIRDAAKPHGDSLERGLLALLGVGADRHAAILGGDAINASDVTGRYVQGEIIYLMGVDGAAALHIWNHYPTQHWNTYRDQSRAIRIVLARFGEAAMPGLERFCSARAEDGLGLSVKERLASAGIAKTALHALRNVKKAKDVAQQWIEANARTTAIVALQQAFSTDKAARDNGAFGLRWLMRQGHEALIDQVAAEYGGEMPEALAALKSADPLNVLPAKIPKLPPFFAPATFARPQLKNGGALPVAAAEHIGTMLAISKLEAPYPGLDIVRDACTPESLAEFAWDLFEAWMTAGAPAKENWAFNALGLLGDNETVRRLAPKIREWPGESAHARAVTGLDLLTAIGTDLALMNLNAIANKVKFKGLQEKAREKIAAIAEARGLTTDELADRLVPDLGLDEAGALTLDFGPRQFTVAFDETLKPFVRDAQGARLKDLPKPIKSDDADKANAATERYKQLKKDAKAIASMQVTRLELAMVAQRRWSADDFRLFFLQHPVMRFLAQRLVWGVYVDGAFSQGFRVAEDLTLADAQDDTFTLPDGASVGLAHVLEMPADAQTAFGQALADYEILQPFRQLGRETYALTADELKAGSVTRFADKTVSVGSVMGLINRGWERGQAQDAGWVGEFSKPAGNGHWLVADLEPGLVIGDLSYEPKQHIKSVTLCAADTWGHGDALPLSHLSAIAASEMLRDLDLLAPYEEKA